MDEEDQKDQKEALAVTKDIFETATEITGLSSTISGFLEKVNEKKPKIAKGLGVAAKVCKSVICYMIFVQN